MNYETLIITFAEPIRTLDDFFDNPETWGVASPKEWIDRCLKVPGLRLSTNAERS